MRHALILFLASAFFALVTTAAWHYDTSRATQVARERQQAIDARLQELETDYLQGARSLLALVPADLATGHPSKEDLLAQIDAMLASPASSLDRNARDIAFDDLVGRVRDVLLRVAPETFGDSIAQEWRRQNDRMNGALHRRNLLLEQARP